LARIRRPYACMRNLQARMKLIGFRHSGTPLTDGSSVLILMTTVGSLRWSTIDGQFICINCTTIFYIFLFFIFCVATSNDPAWILAILCTSQQVPLFVSASGVMAYSNLNSPRRLSESTSALFRDSFVEVHEVLF
jgi:hypothetical protein